MSEEMKAQESMSLGIILSIIDGSIDPTFHTAPSSSAALEALQKVAQSGPTHTGITYRIYMEGQNALLQQLSTALRSVLAVAGYDIEGTNLAPNSPVAAQHRDALFAQMQQMQSEAEAAESAAEGSVAEESVAEESVAEAHHE